jgi:hypothetical protein
VARVVIAWAGNKIMDPLADAAFLVVSLSLTALVVIKGRQELAKVQSVRGRVPLTGWQAFLVIVLMIAFGAFGVWVIDSM